MFYKIVNVKTMTDYNLLVQFQNGVEKIYNLNPLFEKWEDFKDLMNIRGLFEQVKVDKGGYGISWNDEIDLSCNELWNNGEIVKENVE
jgi:Protein of unknown function (DUF2442).